MVSTAAEACLGSDSLGLQSGLLNPVLQSNLTMALNTAHRVQVASGEGPKRRVATASGRKGSLQIVRNVDK